MKFFLDDQGGLWPLSKVERIETKHRDVGNRTMKWHVAHLDSGEEIRMEAGEFENVRRMGARVFAAAPGYSVVHVDTQSAENDPIHLTPVVGWMVDPDLGLVPLTLDGVNDGMDDVMPIKFPDGTIGEFHAGVHPSLESYVDALIGRKKFD